MSLNVKQFLSVLFCCLPSLCFGIGLDTKIAWEPWAVNAALMNFCMPELKEGDRVTEGGNVVWVYRRHEYSSVGDISMLVTHPNSIITAEKVELVPKCSAFIDKYIAYVNTNPKISLNQIISICLDTIEDRLMCENIILSLVNLTEDKKVLRNYNPKKIEQKIRDSIKADHKICSDDGLFCTTYNLFSQSRRKDSYSLEGAETDAIYRNSDSKIIGVCAGINREDVFGLAFIHGDSRCIATDSQYELYEFDIKDFTDKSIELTYTDWGKMTDVSKKYLERVNPLIQKLDNCIAHKNVDADTSWASDTYKQEGTISLPFVMCEKYNYQPNQEDKVMVCKAEILKQLYKDSQKCLQNISFEAAEHNLGQYKSILEKCFSSIQTFQYQSLTLLSKCEN